MYLEDLLMNRLNMNEYLNYLDEQTKGLSNIEKLRYAYIDLGLKFTFNTDYVFETRFDKKYKLYEKKIPV